MTARPKPTRTLPHVPPPTQQQALVAGAAALRSRQRLFAPEAQMYIHGIDSPIHERCWREYERCRAQADLLLALSKIEPH